MKKQSKEMKEALGLIKKLRPVFFLQGWTIDTIVHRDPDHDEPNMAAKCEVKNCYKDAGVHFYPRFFKESKQRKLEIVIHELCHIPTGIQNGLIQTARKSTQISDAESAYAQEEETSWFANIISALIENNKI